jgi:hypothetical protein
VASQINGFRNVGTKERTSTEDESYGLLGCEAVVWSPFTPTLEEPAALIFYSNVTTASFTVPSMGVSYLKQLILKQGY